MNVTELARQVRVTTQDLRLLLPEMGFDVGSRAIKIDPKVAQAVSQRLNNKYEREKLLAGLKKEVEPAAEQTSATGQELETPANKISIPQQVVVKDLAGKMGVPVTKLVVELMKQGVMASLNDKIDFETASIVAEDHGFQAALSIGNDQAGETESRDIAAVIGEVTGPAIYRPPVIVVMGHVDHGKTKLLDAIRQTHIVDEESGGITQHIGAYQVEFKNKENSKIQKLTFIDTPGHEAFSLMRSRGARVADLAILVVAADDGVQPQTIEAISHIKKAALPFVVAINKIDKPEANLDNVKAGLNELGITPEDWGGEVMMVPVSAKKGANIEVLLESLLLVFEMHKESVIGDPAGVIAGTIIEAHVDQGSGPIATVLMRNGTLKLGQDVLVGNIPGRIRLMKDWQGRSLTAAGPSTPVAILGLRSAPRVGDILQGVARVEMKKHSRRHKQQLAAESIKKKIISETKGTQFNIIIKADVLGSLEALQESLLKLNNQDISLNIVNQGLGYINEADVLLAESSAAYVLGFNAYATTEALELARSKEVTVKSFEVIYDYLDFVAQEASKKLKPELLKKELGALRVLKIFRREKNYFIAGGRILRGEIKNQIKVEHYRGKQKLGEGFIDELQSGKEIVNQVVEGQEAGLKISRLKDLEPGDDLIGFEEEIKERKVEL